MRLQAGIPLLSFSLITLLSAKGEIKSEKVIIMELEIIEDIDAYELAEKLAEKICDDGMCMREAKDFALRYYKNTSYSEDFTEQEFLDEFFEYISLKFL